MSKFILSVALGLASLGGFVHAEMPLSPVVSKGEELGEWHLVRYCNTEALAHHVGKSLVDNHHAKQYMVTSELQSSNDGQVRVWLLWKR
jgi:hypothetical protein